MKRTRLLGRRLSKIFSCLVALKFFGEVIPACGTLSIMRMTLLYSCDDGSILLLFGFGFGWLFCVWLANAKFKHDAVMMRLFASPASRHLPRQHFCAQAKILVVSGISTHHKKQGRRRCPEVWILALGIILFRPFVIGKSNISLCSQEPLHKTAAPPTSCRDNS